MKRARHAPTAPGTLGAPSIARHDAGAICVAARVGVVGAPTRRIAWTARTPVNPDGENGKPLTPEGFAIAGDYLFFGMVKPDEGLQRTYAMDAKTGEVVGYFVPDETLGRNAGWQDMPFSVDAIQRKDGSYLVMVEEDWRGKNIIYRWRPDAK